MSGGYGGLTTGYIVSGGTQVTTTEVVTDIQNALTNIDTKSDAWGKVIPVSFGRCRIAGALVWASQFYRTTSSFDDTTTTKDIYTSYGYASGDDAVAHGGTISDIIPLTPEDVSTSKSQVTHIVQTDTFIDLCYSFGKEGDKRKKRYVDKIRINNIVVFDSSSGYIASGLGFSVRYGYDDAVPSLLAQYPNGIYHYPGQTLVIFNRFPLANYGDKIPDSIDVEFGCCLSDFDCVECGSVIELDRYVSRADATRDRISPNEITWKPCHVIVMVIATTQNFTPENDALNKIVADMNHVRGISFTRGEVDTYYRVVDQAFADKYNNEPFQLVTPWDAGGAKFMLGKVRVIQIPTNKAGAGIVGPGQVYQDPGGLDYVPADVVGPNISIRDTFVFNAYDGSANGNLGTADPIYTEGTGCKMASHVVTVNPGETKKDGDVMTISDAFYNAVNQLTISFAPCDE